MSLGLDGLDIHAAGFPRVSGDEPAHVLPTGTRAKFSPRERG